MTNITFNLDVSTSTLTMEPDKRPTLELYKHYVPSTTVVVVYMMMMVMHTMEQKDKEKEERSTFSNSLIFYVHSNGKENTALGSTS